MLAMILAVGPFFLDGMRLCMSCGSILCWSAHYISMSLVHSRGRSCACPGAGTAEQIPDAGAENNYRKGEERRKQDQPGILIQCCHNFTTSLHRFRQHPLCCVCGR